MKKTYPILLLITAALLSFTSCKKESSSPLKSPGVQDPVLVGSWGQFNFYTRVFDDAGVEYTTQPPFEYGRGDWWYEYKNDGTFYTKGDDNTSLAGKWRIKNGKLIQGDTEYEYSFADNNRTLILKKFTDFTDNGVKYRRDEYSTLSKDWLP